MNAIPPHQCDNNSPIDENTPLNRKKRRRRCKWRIWDPTSPNFRFFLLWFACCVPVGGHFVKNCMSALEPLILSDPTFPINNTMYGGLISAVSIPSLFIPFFGGSLIDRKGHHGILLFLLLMVFGQIAFVLAMESKSYWCAIIGRIIFGIGEGSVVVGARVIVSHWFASSELTFAMGATVAVSNFSKMLAKSTVAPIALALGGYTYALWYCVIVCIFSVIMGMIVLHLTTQVRAHVLSQVLSEEEVQPELEWLEKRIRRKRIQSRSLLSSPSEHQHSYRLKLNWQMLTSFSTVFWLVVFLHVVFINVFHLFQNVSSSYLYQRYGYTVVKAGLVSSFSHSFVIFAPVIGMAIDKVGGRMAVILLSAVLSIGAYVILLFTDIPPIVAMVIMSLCLAVTPTALMAAIPLTVPTTCFGVAFGIIEVTDAFGSTFGNLVVGYERDVTQSYDRDMHLLLGMACFSLVLGISLYIADREGVLSKKIVSKLRARLATIDAEDPIAADDYSASSGSNSSDDCDSDKV